MTRDQADVAELALLDQAAHVAAEGIETKVEVDGMDAAALLGQLQQLGRLRRRHGQRLFTDDMLAGAQRCTRVLVMQVVG